jgi:CRP/FNR family transcriptional regulator, nitrogen fixation regulation protein
MEIEALRLRGPSTHRFGRLMGRGVVEPAYPLPTLDVSGPPMSLARNAEIYAEGDPADHLYKIASGMVRTCKFLVDGRRQIGGFYLPGDIFGLEPESEYTFSAEAVTEVEVIAVKRAAASSTQLLALMSRELQSTQNHLLLLAKTAPERVASFLLEMAERIQSAHEVELGMSRQDIADYLGLTIETVSRTLTQLENESTIALPTSKRVVLRNRATLKRLNS